MVAAWLAFFDGLLAVVLIAVGIVGAHFYLIPPFMGFQLFALGFLLSIIGTLIGFVAIFMTRKPQLALGRNRALVGTVLCLLVAIPMIITLIGGAKYPPINDITTDVDNPPEFVFALTLPANQNRDMKYDKAKYADKQLAGYGQLAPLKEQLDPGAAFQRVSETAKQVPTWTITYSDPAKNQLEAVATSKLFHFHDDVVIQVRPSPDGASLIEMRSKSRDGVGDFGVNEKRIRRFFDRIALNRGKTEDQEETR